MIPLVATWPAIQEKKRAAYNPATLHIQRLSERFNARCRVVLLARRFNPSHLLSQAATPGKQHRGHAQAEQR